MEHSRFEKELADMINASFPYIYIPSYEEERVVAAIRAAAQDQTLIKTRRAVAEWTQTGGLTLDGAKKHDTAQPMNALEQIERAGDPGIFILKDFHVYFGPDRNVRPDYAVIRRLRDMTEALKNSKKTVIFLSPKLVIPCDMEKEISVLDFELPTEEETLAMIDGLIRMIPAEKVHLDDSEKRLLARSALGLTMQEAENALSHAMAALHGLDKNAVRMIHEEKNQVVKKTGVLEFVKSDLSVEDIGGLENLKKWLRRRDGAWSERAKAYRLPAPKGVLITGVPGCGKSLTAKAMSAIWGLPLLKLDMGKIFGGIVGSSEENMRKAIATAEAVSPSILWVDEIEKGFTGTRAGGDSGTSARVFGTFLTWMQEKTKPVFVIATANDISSLPPELLRKGRFDEIFFVDLPTFSERKKIFAVHIAKRLRDSAIAHEADASDAVCTELAALTRGYVGAEIEQIVISAMYEAFYENRGLKKEDIIKAIRETVPLSATQAEQILALREWAKERAVLATAVEDREEAPTGEDPAGGIAAQGGRLVDF